MPVFVHYFEVSSLSFSSEEEEKGWRRDSVQTHHLHMQRPVSWRSTPKLQTQSYGITPVLGDILSMYMHTLQGRGGGMGGGRGRGGEEGGGRGDGRRKGRGGELRGEVYTQS